MKTDFPASRTLPEPSEKVEITAVEVGRAEETVSWDTVEEAALEERASLVEEACLLEET